MQKLNELLSADLFLFNTSSIHYSIFSWNQDIWARRKKTKALLSQATVLQTKWKITTENKATVECFPPTSVQVAQELQGCSFYRSFLHPNKALSFKLQIHFPSNNITNILPSLQLSLYLLVSPTLGMTTLQHVLGTELSSDPASLTKIDSFRRC